MSVLPLAPRPAPRRLYRVALCLAVAAGCGGGGDAPTSPVAPVAPARSCGLLLGATSVAPLAPVTVAGIAPSETLAVAVTAPGTSGSTVRLPLTHDLATGQLAFVAPPYPDAPFTGGTVRVTVVRADAATPLPSCTGTSLTIAPLERAPGTSVAMLGALDSLVGALATSVGSSPGALDDSVPTLPVEVQPVALAYQLFDGARNPNSLRHLLDGSAPVLGGTGAYDPALLDAVLERAGVLDSLAAVLRDVRALGSPTSATSLVAADRTAPAATFALTPGAAAPRSMAAALGANPAAAITTAAQLDRAMRQNELRVKARDGLKHYITGLSAAFGALGALPEAAGGVVAVPVAAVAGMVIFGSDLVASGVVALAPQTLDPIQGFASPRVLAVDARTTGQYGQLTLTAKSAEWRVGLPTFADGLLGAGGAGIGAVAEHGIRRVNALLELLPTVVRQKVAAALVAPVAALLNSVFGDAIKAGAYVAGPLTYGPVDLADPKWTTTTVAPASLLALGTNGEGTYTPTGTAGAATVTIATRPEYFRAQKAEFAFTVQVGAVSLAITPASTQARPGGSIFFVAAYTGATTAGVRWSATGGTVDQLGRWTAPSAEGTYAVTATDADLPSISASATVRVANAVVVHVQPVATVELEPGRTFAFTGSVEGATNQALTWTATKGTVSNTGFYTAPNDTGTYAVTATSVQDPKASAAGSVHVRVPAPWSIRLVHPNASYGVVSPNGRYVVASQAGGTGAVFYVDRVAAPYTLSLPGLTIDLRVDVHVNDVNDAGQSVGSSGGPGGHAFLREASGAALDLTARAGVVPGEGGYGHASDVNRAGQVLFSHAPAQTRIARSYVYTPGAALADVGAPGGPTINYASAGGLNDRSEAVAIFHGDQSGYYGIWRNGTVTPLPAGYGNGQLFPPTNAGHVLLQRDGASGFALWPVGGVPAPIPDPFRTTRTQLLGLTDDDLLAVEVFTGGNRDNTNLVLTRTDGTVVVDVRSDFAAQLPAGVAVRAQAGNAAGLRAGRIFFNVGAALYLLEPGASGTPGAALRRPVASRLRGGR